MSKDKSLKKKLGAVGCCVVWAMSAYAVYKDPNLIGIVLPPNVLLAMSLFAIKTAGGTVQSVMSKRGDHE